MCTTDICPLIDIINLIQDDNETTVGEVATKFRWLVDSVYSPYRPVSQQWRI